jgi:transposase
VFRIWRMLLGLCDRTVLEGVDIDEDTETVVAHVRPKRPKKRRCGQCGRLSPHEDNGDGWRRWRGLDLGTVRVWLEADAPRVRPCLPRRGDLDEGIRSPSDSRGSVSCSLEHLTSSSLPTRFRFPPGRAAQHGLGSCVRRAAHEPERVLDRFHRHHCHRLPPDG